MNHLTVHKKIVGKIQINTFAYEKGVFKIIVKRLINSDIFHSVTTQSINHSDANFKRKTCNCDDILQFIASEFHAETERFCQIFVPIILVDYQSKLRHYVICELLYLHGKLLKSRKEFFIEDVKENALFNAKKYKENCVCKLSEILTIDQHSMKHPGSSIPRISTSKVNNACLREVMKELVANNLLPLSCKNIPLDSHSLQKVLDICNRYYLPDEVTVSILNNLRSVKAGNNQSNNDGKEYNKCALYNISDNSFTSEKSEKSWNFLTNNSAKKASINKSHISGINDATVVCSNTNNIRRDLYEERTLHNYPDMENSHNKSYSSLRTLPNRRTGGDPRFQSRQNPQSQNWGNYVDGGYRPTTLRTSLQPQMSASYHNQRNKRSNFHWGNRDGSQTIGNTTFKSDYRGSPSNRQYSRGTENAYLNYRESREPSNLLNNWHDSRPDYHDNTYEVVIDDECHNLGNVETICVRDADGNYKTYVDSEIITPTTYKSTENVRTVSKKPSKKVTFNAELNKDLIRPCDSNTLTKAVLCQEANSMNALMNVLNRKVERDEMNQCMKLSVRAEHIIKRPDCPDEIISNNNPNDCLTISSEVQAQWENINCDEESKTPTFPIDPAHGQSTYSLNSHLRSVGTSPKNFSKTNHINQSIYDRGTSPLEMDLQTITNLCDKAMQTEKFLFLETCNERIILSPNSFEGLNQMPQTRTSMATNRRIDSYKSINKDQTTRMESMRSGSKGFSLGNQYNDDDACEQFYFYEDKNKRLVYSPNELCFEHKETQTSHINPHYSSHFNRSTMNPKFSNIDHRPVSFYNEPENSNLGPSVGDYYRDSRNDINSKYNFSMTDDSRYMKSNYIAPDQNGNRSYSPINQIQNSSRAPYPNDSLRHTSRVYSLTPYLNTMATKSFTNSHNSEQTPLTQQMNYSTSGNYKYHKISSSPEEYLYIESRKISPILDIQASSGYNQLLNNQNTDPINLSPVWFQSSIKNPSKKIQNQCYTFFNSNQVNNSNLNCAEISGKNPKYFIYETSENSQKGEPCVSVDFSSMNIIPNKCKKPFSQNLKKHSKKTSRYVVNCSKKRVKEHCHYMNNYRQENKTLIHRNRIDCKCRKSMIPIIPANHKNKYFKNYKSKSNQNHDSPYAKSIQYLKEIISRKKNNFPNENAQFCRSNKKIDIAKLIPIILKDLKKFDNLLENDNVRETVDKKNCKGLKKIKEINLSPNTISLSKSFKNTPENGEEEKLSKVVIFKCIEDNKSCCKPKKNSTVYKAIVLKKKCSKKTKSSILQNVEVNSNEHNFCSDKWGKNDNKYSEVEVDFNQI